MAKGFVELRKWPARSGKVRDGIEMGVDVGMGLIARLNAEELAPVPVPDFDLVERSEVVYEAAAKLVPAPQFADTVIGGVGFSGAAELPGADAVTEVVGREFVEADLRVVQTPSAAVPVLNDPVIGPLTVSEVVREAAAGTRGHALGAQQCAVHNRKVVAVPDQTFFLWSLVVERGGVDLKDAVDGWTGTEDPHAVAVWR